MDKEQFTRAAEAYQPMVYRIAYNYFGSASDADDATQDVFLKLYTQKKPFQSEEHLRHWLIRVTVNQCKDVLKSPWRKRRVSLDAIADRPVFDSQDEADLFREVMALPEKYRTVLNLFYYEELSVKEIADVLGVKVSAVTTRLSRARAQLKTRLEVWQNV